METVRQNSKTTARVGIIGAGNIASRWDEVSTSMEAKTHAKAFSQTAGCQIVSILDQDTKRAEEAAQFWKIPHSTSKLSDFVAQDLDVICLCTPEAARLSILKDIPAKKGMVLICEKPLAATAQEAEGIVKLCQEKGWLLMVNFIRSFGQGFQELHKILQTQELGTLEKIIAHYGKGFRNNGSHMLQLILQLAGKPTQAKTLNTFPDDRSSTDDKTLDVQIQFSGLNAYMTANDHRDFTVFEVDLFLSQGRIQVSDRGNKIEVSKVIDDPVYPGYKILKKDRELSAGLKNHFSNLALEAIALWKKGSQDSSQIQSVLLTHHLIEELSKRGSYGI